MPSQCIQLKLKLENLMTVDILSNYSSMFAASYFKIHILPSLAMEKGKNTNVNKRAVRAG